jgi:cytosine/adenosine deaminase-related metal-dependent hydrolase
MQLLITDTVVVTNDEERRILDRAAIAIDGDRIAAVGASDAHPRWEPRSCNPAPISHGVYGGQRSSLCRWHRD